MSGHEHNHTGGCCHSHDDVGSDSNLGILYSLYSKIDLENLQCLNELEENSGKKVFKSWDERLSKESCTISDIDDELVFNIPFSGCVKLKSIVIFAESDDSHPAYLKLYKNRGYMTFDDVKSEPDQEFALSIDTTATIEYPVKTVKFSSVYNLTLHFPKSFGADFMKIYYIGLRGEFTQAQRDKVVLASYELAANPCDHKVTEKKNMNYDVY